MGRKAKPAALHKLRGTYQPVRHAGEPEAPGELLSEPPDWMSAGQQAAWRYCIDHAPLGILRRIDRGILTVWVIAEDEHRRAIEAQAALDRDSAMPLLVRDKRGNAIISPYVRIIRRSADAMVKASAELGFTPCSRPRLANRHANGGVPADKSSPWAQLRVLQGGKSV